ncbi:hypothetical protein ACIOUE_37620 [Streptomyces xanthochromogenes]
MRSDEPDHGEAGHTALVEAIARGDAEAAGRTLRAELHGTLTQLRAARS